MQEMLQKHRQTGETLWNILLKALVPLSAKAGGAGAAGSSSVSVGGINQRTVLLGAAGTGKNQRGMSVVPSYSHFSVEQVVQEQPLSF